MPSQLFKEVMTSIDLAPRILKDVPIVPLWTLRQSGAVLVSDDRMVQARQENYEMDSLNRCTARQRAIRAVAGAFCSMTLECGHDLLDYCHCSCEHPQCAEANREIEEADRVQQSALSAYYAALDAMVAGDEDFQDDVPEPAWLAFDQPTNEQ